MKKPKFYSLDKILKQKCIYNVIIGERSNGKTFAALLHGVKAYADSGEQMAIIRRWKEDFVGKRGQSMFEALVAEGEIEKATNDEWNGVFYHSGRWYLCRYDDGQRVCDETPFAYGFSLASMEHDKSTSYPRIMTVVFDEFLSRSAYLPDEFVIFMNCLSTIIRQRAGVKIFMLGNTVNKYSPYFGEMGLKHIKEMKPGDIDVYRYGEGGPTVAVEYCDTSKGSGKPSDIYFAFDNSKLSMITGGEWEIAVYPHLPAKYAPKDVVFTCFIIWDRETLQLDVVSLPGMLFGYIHRKTGEIKHPGTDIVYCPEYDPRPAYRRDITKPRDEVGKRIWRLFQLDKVFYQDNETGEVIRNYIQWCKSGTDIQ